MSKVVETLCGTSYSKSMVSEVCKDLDAMVNEFRNRPLTNAYPFVLIDATYFKVRYEHRIVSKAFMVAYATNNEGKRGVIGFDLFDNESNNTWFMFIESLRKRGLHGVRVITSDAHPGILYAIKKVFPEVAWTQIRSPGERTRLHTELLEMYNAKDITEARKIRDRIIGDYSDVAPAAMECLDAGFESAMTVMVLPDRLRVYHRTSNHIERLNRELKRRSKVIGVFPNDASVIRIMGSVLMEVHEAFASAKGGGYPRKQLEAINDYIPQLREIAEEQLKLLAA